MAKHRSNSNLILPALLALAVLGALVFWRGWKTASIQVATEPNPSPELSIKGDSADGKLRLELKPKTSAGQTAWSLTVTDSSGNWKTIWTQTFPDNVNFSIPLNSVSPDNQYLFLKETMPGKTLYLVLAASGTPLNKTASPVEFAGPFSLMYPNLEISDATGWAAPTLIVFNTDKVDGGIGPSFWFDLSSQSFIQLSNRFN